MALSRGEDGRTESPRLRARRHCRTAFAMALVFGTLPLASRLFLGEWGFEGAGEIGCLCLIAAVYFYIVSRRFPAIPDPASILEQAGQHASAGRPDRAIALLTEAIRLSPQLWQAFQYRGEMYLRQGAQDAALRDISEAIRLAPREPHLYLMRGHVQLIRGDEPSARADFEKTVALGGQAPSEEENPAGPHPGVVEQ